jgi:arsenite methyltransferase
MTGKSNSPSRSEAIRTVVRSAYSKIASRGGSCCGSSSGCGSGRTKTPRRLVGYSGADLASLPSGADMGLGCGNPAAFASLRPGETVLDLGSGGGVDVFIAARRVGRRGRVIGVDMTPEMLSKARRNAEAFQKRSGLDNVEFRLGEIEHLPVADGSVDVIISNCVLNLSPDKPQVWREIARTLKLGGRAAVSDLALLKPLPPKVANMVEALAGCVAGAVLVSDTRKMMRRAGLVDIVLTPRAGYVETMAEWHDPLYSKIARNLPRGAKLSDYVTSLSISARKPGRRKS